LGKITRRDSLTKLDPNTDVKNNTDLFGTDFAAGGRLGSRCTSLGAAGLIESRSAFRCRGLKSLSKIARMGQ
jgi:hypothetical protein